MQLEEVEYLGTINWFHGKASPFYGIQYHISKKITLSSEYNLDLMLRESSYLNIKKPSGRHIN